MHSAHSVTLYTSVESLLGTVIVTTIKQSNNSLNLIWELWYKDTWILHRPIVACGMI